MNKELSSIYKGKLTGLPFVDLLCGMVQTLTKDDPVDETKVIQKKMPVTYDHNLDPDCIGQEILPIPDSSRKSIIYFEDFGISVIDKRHGLTKYQSSLRLICWLNRSKLVGDNYIEISGRVMATIVDRLANKSPYNSGMFTTITTRVARIPPQDAGLFSRYTYEEKDRQYLRPPFEFFGIDLQTDFFANQNCLEDIEWNLTNCP